MLVMVRRISAAAFAEVHRDVELFGRDPRRPGSAMGREGREVMGAALRPPPIRPVSLGPPTKQPRSVLIAFAWFVKPATWSSVSFFFFPSLEERRLTVRVPPARSARMHV